MRLGLKTVSGAGRFRPAPQLTERDGTFNRLTPSNTLTLWPRGAAARGPWYSDTRAKKGLV